LGLSGTALCVIAALTYTVANICLRRLSELGCDPVWTICVKESIAVFVVGPWLLWQALQGRKTLPDRFTLLLLIAVGLLTELFGNLSWQWAVGVVGIAVTVPASFGLSITGGAILGWLFLKERVSWQSAVAIAVIWVALGFLGAGANSVNATPETASGGLAGPMQAILGIAAASLSGVVFAILGIASCYSVRHSTPPVIVGFWIMLMGLVSLGPLSVYRLGVPQLLATTPEQMVLMFVAGIFNLIGFTALFTGMQRTTVVQANVTNASQVAFAAVAGMLLFHELPNIWLVLGIILTIIGILGGGQLSQEDEPIIGSTRV
jgi:drug/metabolite transporter (DMT)-like permease